MAVGNRKVFAYIGTDPEALILLIHWIHVYLVLSRSWEILFVGYNLGLCAECEPWLFTELFRFIQRISKVKVTQKSVSVGGRAELA